MAGDLKPPEYTGRDSTRLEPGETNHQTVLDSTELQTGAPHE